MGTTYTLFTSKNTWIEGEALEQLKQLATIPEMSAVMGMPDLHAGKGCPIGVVSLSKHHLFPALAGSDIGCGIGLWNTDLQRRKAKRDRWAARLNLEGTLPEVASPLAEAGLSSTAFDAALGTIGGGNHFAELQCIEEVFDTKACLELGLSKTNLVLTVHSGSRGLGQHILDTYLGTQGYKSIPEHSEEAERYLEAHDHALRWAVLNRKVIAHRFLRCIGADWQRVLDGCHNMISRELISNEEYWVHRKGAASTRSRFVVVPGSRGSATYLLQAKGDQTANAYTIAHGAGRKWKRSEVKGRLSKRYSVADLQQTRLGSLVLCDDRRLLYEEAPQAYKNIEQVISDLEHFGLVSRVARLSPIITYKSRQL